MAGVKVIREGDHVTIDMGSNDVLSRYTPSLSQGCNPIGYEARDDEGPTWQYRYVYTCIYLRIGRDRRGGAKSTL